jgi:hypothetical protein
MHCMYSQFVVNIAHTQALGKKCSSMYMSVYVVYVILENVVIVNINYLERCSMPPMFDISEQAIISRYESLLLL